MKQTKIVFILALIIGLVSGCESDNQNSEESTDQILERIENNYNLSYNLFEKLQLEISPDSIIELREASATKNIFIENIDNVSIEIFPNEVEVISSSLVLDYIPMPFGGDAKELLKVNLNNDEPFIDVVDEYSEAVLSLAEQQNSASDGHKEWVILQSNATGQDLENISFNFEEVSNLIALHLTLMNPNFSDEEITEQIDEFLSENETSAILVGLLLPAIQPPRDPSLGTPFETALTDWLDANVNPAIPGGMNSNITRKIQAIVYLAGLHTLILEDFPNNNVDMVSLSVLHARYRAAILMSASEMWDHR